MKTPADRRTGRSARRRAEGGFCILEISITIALLASITLGTSLLLVPLARQSRIGRETQLANAAARRVLEQLQATPFKDIPEDYPNGSARSLSELPSGRLVVTYDDAAADPLVVHAEVSWTSEDLGPITRTFDTIRTE